MKENKKTEQNDFIKDKNLDETTETKKKAPELCVCARERERKYAKESVGVRTPNSDFAFASFFLFLFLVKTLYSFQYMGIG